MVSRAFDHRGRGGVEMAHSGHGALLRIDRNTVQVRGEGKSRSRAQTNGQDASYTLAATVDPMAASQDSTREMLHVTCAWKNRESQNVYP